MLEYFTKTSRESLDYTIAYARWLEGRESISQASAIVTPNTAYITYVGYTNDQVVIWLTGGEQNQQYIISASITTDQGRRKDERFLVLVVDEDGTHYQTPFAGINDIEVTCGWLG